MSAHDCLIRAGENLRNAEFWIHHAGAYEFSEVDEEHIKALAERSFEIAKRLEELRKEKAA